MVTLGCSAMYASAAFWKSVLPGSPVVMCHQSTVTGSPPAAADAGASDAPPAVGAASDGAPAEGAALPPPPPHAANTVAAVARRTANRRRVLIDQGPPRANGRVTARERARWAMTSPP